MRASPHPPCSSGFALSGPHCAGHLLRGGEGLNFGHFESRFQARALSLRKRDLCITSASERPFRSLRLDTMRERRRGQMQRQQGQLSLADGLVKGAKNFLTEAEVLIDWSRIEHQLEGIYSASTGRPSYPLLTLFKAMLLQQWYGLSDPRTEEALNDSISFRRFVGLSLSDTVPDHSTLSRFRAQLGNRLESLLEAFNAQLDLRGLIVRQGTLIDASFIQSSSRKSRVDSEAGSYGGQKEGHNSGYKMHASVDQFSGLVRKVIVTSANINDTTPADQLILGDEAAVYADKAYD